MKCETVELRSSVVAKRVNDGFRIELELIVGVEDTSPTTHDPTMVPAS